MNNALWYATVLILDNWLDTNWVHALHWWEIQVVSILQGGSYIFEFESYPDMHICRDFVGKDNSINQIWPSDQLALPCYQRATYLLNKKKMKELHRCEAKFFTITFVALA